MAEALHELWSWCETMGMQMHPDLGIGYDGVSGERSMIARAPIARGTEILRVPRRALFLAETVAENRLTQSELESSTLERPDALALALLSELDRQSLGSPSLWAPFFATLPRRLNTPLWYNSTERQHLRGTDVLRWTVAREKAIMQSRQQLASSQLYNRSSTSGRDAAFAAYDVAWAFSVLHSRVFMVDLSNAAVRVKQPALVPLGDFFNHREDGADKVSAHSDVEGNAFVYRAWRDIGADEELTLRYGPGPDEITNSELLHDYGFVTPFAPHEKLELALPSNTGADPVTRAAMLGFGERLTLTLETAELPANWASDEARRLLGQAIDSRLEEYNTRLDEDERLLAVLTEQMLDGAEDEPLSPRARDARHVVAGEKRVLHHWRRLLSVVNAAAPETCDGSADPGPMPGEAEGVWSFRAAGIGWDPASDRPARAAPPATSEGVLLGVRQLGERRSVVLVSGALQLGELVGCYSGEPISAEQRFAKRQALGSENWERYLFQANASHWIDPTGPTGTLDSTSPPWRWEMALVNEPSTSRLPNASPLDYEYGRCRDRFGAAGVPYYAVRDISAGEEVTVCYGPDFPRDYETSCTDHALLGRWTHLQKLLLAPFLTAPPEQ